MHLIDNGWKIKMADCGCGGWYVWVKPIGEVYGCICHNDPIDNEEWESIQDEEMADTLIKLIKKLDFFEGGPNCP